MNDKAQKPSFQGFLSFLTKTVSLLIKLTRLIGLINE